MNNLDDELSRTLNRHAETMSGAPLAFDDVRGRATSIRRRRQLATGLGVAAAIAVIVPTAMFATNGTNAEGPIPADQTPTAVDTSSPTPTVTPTMGSDPHALDVANLPTGAPASGLVTNGDQAAAQTSEALVRSTQNGVVVEAGGQTFGPYPTSYGIAVNSAGTAAAWTTDEGEVMAWADGESEPFIVATPGLESLSVDAVTGTFCAPGEDRDCLYYVSGYDMATNQNKAFTLTPNGEMGAVDPEGTILTVTDATDDGRVLGLTEIRDDGTCSVLLDPAKSGSTPVFATCKHLLASFSPNGDYVLASDSYGDGIGSGTIAVYDARTGELLADRARTRDLTTFYNSATWEDETHVLFTPYQDGRWSVVRMNVDGAMEYSVPPQKGDEMEVPWHFETR